MMPISLGQTIGDYRIIGILGNGGHGIVLKAENIHDPSIIVAIKLANGPTDPATLSELQKEAQRIAGLQHPHIIRQIGFDVYNQTPYIIMEYALNGSLRDRYPPSSVVNLDIVVEIVKQVASALQYVHDQGLIHRDLKPQNILINSSDEMLLSDFGIAMNQSSTTSNVVGTYLYMAPEVIGTKPEPASDQYALAVMVYELLTGSFPFYAKDPVTLSRMHVQDIPTPPSTLNPAIPQTVEVVISRGLAKDPKWRYKSVDEFADELYRASKGLPSQVPVVDPWAATIVSRPSYYIDQTVPAASYAASTAKRPKLGILGITSALLIILLLSVLLVRDVGSATKSPSTNQANTPTTQGGTNSVSTLTSTPGSITSTPIPSPTPSPTLSLTPSSTPSPTPIPTAAPTQPPSPIPAPIMSAPSNYAGTLRQDSQNTTFNVKLKITSKSQDGSFQGFWYALINGVWEDAYAQGYIITFSQANNQLDQSRVNFIAQNFGANGLMLYYTTTEWDHGTDIWLHCDYYSLLKSDGSAQGSWYAPDNSEQDSFWLQG
jgi:serine/threonine protein kinase